MIQRYSFSERICHWVTSFAYVYCLGTGAAFYTPYLFWIAVILGGGPTSRFWHPVFGVGFVLAALWMHALWRRTMDITPADKAWLDDVKYYATNEDEHVPPQGKYNAGQKLYYWAMFYGAILLLLSGIVMWFPEYVPRGWNGLRATAIVLHECAALITVGAFIIHVYMSVFTVPGSVTAMVRGYVSTAWAKTHHRLWYDQVTGHESKL